MEIYIVIEEYFNPESQTTSREMLRAFSVKDKAELYLKEKESRRISSFESWEIETVDLDQD